MEELESVKVEPLSPAASAQYSPVAAAETASSSPWLNPFLPPSPSSSETSSSSSSGAPFGQQPMPTSAPPLAQVTKVPIPKIRPPHGGEGPKKPPPLVLTSEQFAQLTQAGVLKVNANGQVTSTVSNIQQVSSSFFSTESLRK